MKVQVGSHKLLLHLLPLNSVELYLTHLHDKHGGPFSAMLGPPLNYLADHL